MAHLRTVLGVASPGEAKGVGRGSSSLADFTVQTGEMDLHITHIYIYYIIYIYMHR